MNDKPYRYKRLPGRGRRTKGFIGMAAAQCSLWLGQDHLLSVDRIGMGEEYKRFYFHDIQAITVQRTNSASFWNWALGTIALLCAMVFGFIALNYPPSARQGYFIAGLIVAGFWLILLLINFLRGPSCICRLRTAVQNEVLPSLGRMRSARKAIAILKPLIEQTQGVFVMGDMPLPAPIRPLPEKGAPPPLATARNVPPRLHRPASGLLHGALFGAVIVDAVEGIYAHLNPAWSIYVLASGALILAVTGLSITALVRQREATVSPGLRGLTVFTFIANLLCLFIVFVYGFGSRISYTIRHPGQLPYRIDFYGMAGFKTGSFYADLAEFAIGIAGLFLVLVHILRRGRKPQ